jgi:hypothetical protein
MSKKMTDLEEDMGLLMNRVAKMETDPKQKHQFRVEYVIIITGFALVLACIFGEFWIVRNEEDAEFKKMFFSLCSSACMLVLGYLFGTRNKNN